MRISILGCGWLGKAVGKSLSEAGHSVKGSTRSMSSLMSIAEEGILPYQVNLSPNLSGNDLDSFFRCDVMIVSYTPGFNQEIPDWPYLQQGYLVSEIQKRKIQKVIQISTTSVYPDEVKTMTEDDAQYIKSPHSGLEYLRIENAWNQAPDVRVTSLRLAGLVGPGRHPGRFLSGKKGLKQAIAPVNLIHQQDIVSAIKLLINKEKFGAIYNLCAPEHPSRKEFYTEAAIDLGLEIPEFEDSELGGKLISSEKIQEELGFVFQYPNPIKMLRTSLK